MSWFTAFRGLNCVVLSIAVVGCALADAGGPANQGDCDVVLPTSSDLQQTPRGDDALELLALTLSDSLVADPSIYRRLQKDIRAIRRIQPAVKGVSFWPPYDGKSILLKIGPETPEQFLARAPEQFRCLNERLHAAPPQRLSTNLVVLAFPGIYNTRRLAAIYQGVPGVLSAEANGRLLDGPTISVTVEGDAWHYVFDKASGDCIAGCFEHHLYYTSTSGHGSPRAVQEWRSSSRSPKPTWAERYWRRAGH